MKFLIFAFIITVFSQTLLAQKNASNVYAEIDKKALSLPDSLSRSTEAIAKFIDLNFKTDKERVRAAFIWVASNIEYDVENMFAINFYEKAEDKISKPLKNKKGICENYAALFTDICKKAGINSYVISGYTKQNGFADYIPHAWSAAYVDSSWYIFDPTWGSGYINNGKFVRKIDNAYFKSKPELMLKSHMPFDYLWQFVNYPITNQEFYEGKIQQNKTKPLFNYSDSLIAHEKLDRISQLNAEATRVLASGVKNAMIFDRLQHVRYAIENENNSTYNSAASEYNDAINGYNDYIAYRNKQFTPQKSDAEIQKMVDVPYQKLSSAKSKLAEIRAPSPIIQGMIAQLDKGINDAAALVKEQQAWLMKYFSKGKIARKSMFYDKISVFGVPVK